MLVQNPFRDAALDVWRFMAVDDVHGASRPFPNGTGDTWHSGSPAHSLGVWPELRNCAAKGILRLAPRVACGFLRSSALVGPSLGTAL
jgi:hypothetical protein